MSNYESYRADDGRRAAETEIDLCLLPRAERHPLVFEAFDRLAAGESFIVFNDHDPQPLRMQIEKMRAGEVGWEYVERGPDTFRVRLTRIAPAAGGARAASSGAAESPATIGGSRQVKSEDNEQWRRTNAR